MRLKIILALALTPCFVGATPEQKHGIFWYETPPKNPTEITQDEYPKPVVPDAETLFKMHPKQIKKLLNDTLEYAVYALTPEATLDYYKVQDAMRRKSAAFTNLAGYVMLQKPGMNGAMDYPVTKPGNAVRAKQLDQQITNKIREGRDGYALLYFTQPNCPYCVQQSQILSNFKRETGWLIKEVDILRQPEAAAKFNVDRTPVTVLIKKGAGADDWMPVSVGIDSLSNLKGNLYRLIRQLNGEAAPQQFYMDESQTNGFFDPLADKKI